MFERIHELKNKAIERANYYTKIDFPNLAGEFTELVNILNEMENNKSNEILLVTYNV